MSFPEFLGPLQPVPQALKSFAAPVTQPVGGGGGSNAIAFSMQQQQEPNWCWAATTSSVSVFFETNSQWNQCQVASVCLRYSCCSSPGPCNVQWTLDDPLTQTGNLQGNPFSGPDTKLRLQAEIDQGRPVCCHISWTDGGGHFVAISGYGPTGDVFVRDPLYGDDSVPYEKFVSSYRGSGRWDYTYYTQP